MGRGAAGAALVVVALAAGGCRKVTPPDHGDLAAAVVPADVPPLAGPFAEHFDSGTLDPALWRATSAAYEVRDGALLARNARNRPLWLRPALPCDVQIDFVAWSDSPDGDIKFEVMGDGASFDPDEGAYEASGYVFIFGGWRNSLSTIARRDEHGARLVVDRVARVEPGRKYRMSVRFAGGSIEWFIDDALFLAARDPEPLCGPGHAHFAFNDWAAPVHFDDLTITPARVAQGE